MLSRRQIGHHSEGRWRRRRGRWCRLRDRRRCRRGSACARQRRVCHNRHDRTTDPGTIIVLGISWWVRSGSRPTSSPSRSMERRTPTAGPHRCRSAWRSYRQRDPLDVVASRWSQASHTARRSMPPRPNGRLWLAVPRRPRPPRQLIGPPSLELGRPPRRQRIRRLGRLGNLQSPLPCRNHPLKPRCANERRTLPKCGTDSGAGRFHPLPTTGTTRSGRSRS